VELLKVLSVTNLRLIIFIKKSERVLSEKLMIFNILTRWGKIMVSPLSEKLNPSLTNTPE